MEVNLSEEGEEAMVWVSAELEPTFKAKLVQLLREYKYVFLLSYESIESVSPRFYGHQINLKPRGILVLNQRYQMNPKYSKQVKEEIDRL